MPLVVYTLLRAVLLAAAFAGLYLAGMRGLLLALVAIVVAALLSYVLLPRQRTAAAEFLAARAQRRSGTGFAAGVDADARAEDEALEASAEREDPRS